MLELAKLIHDAIGIESPRLFIGVCAFVGALIFGILLGWLIDKGYRVKLQEQQRIQAASPSLRTQEPKPEPYGPAAPLQRIGIIKHPAAPKVLVEPPKPNERIRM
jgi:hypothetical protein